MTPYYAPSSASNRRIPAYAGMTVGGAPPDVIPAALTNRLSRSPLPSFPRKRESGKMRPYYAPFSASNRRIPAYAGMTVGEPRPPYYAPFSARNGWIPACAGMTVGGRE